MGAKEALTERGDVQISLSHCMDRHGKKRKGHYSLILADLLGEIVRSMRVSVIRPIGDTVCIQLSAGVVGISVL